MFSLFSRRFPSPCRLLLSRGFSWHYKPSFDQLEILKNADNIVENVKIRNARTANPTVVFDLIRLKESLDVRLVALRPEQLEASEKVKNAKSPEERKNAVEKAKIVKENMHAIQAELNDLLPRLDSELLKLPNMTSPRSPQGPESASKILESVNKIPLFNFNPLSHIALARRHDLADFDQAAHISGSRFYYLKNEFALMELALIQFAMNFYISHGFSPVLPPDLVHTNFITAAGFQPRDLAETQVYHLDKQWNLSLVGTAEIPMAGYYTNRILDKSRLPLKTISFGHAFRTEAGGTGRENKGLYRVHQFSKVELFVVAEPEKSEEIFQQMLELQKEFFAQLGIHFRLLEIATEDLGAPAYRKVDCEALMPGKGLEALVPTQAYYGEISSTSNCTDYQARRLNIRIENNRQPEFAHTLNGTACAIPRMIIAIAEQNQQADGSIKIPEVLRPFMMGIEKIPDKRFQRNSEEKQQK